MQENEFEKQLKNLMDDLDLKPSDAVWEKVKRKLNDRHRRVLPLFILLFAGLSVAGYFLYHNAEQQNKISNTAISTTKENNPNKISTDSLKESNKIFQQKTTAVQTENNSADKNQTPNNSEVYALHAQKKEGQIITTDQNIETKKADDIPQKKQPLQPIEINPQLQSSTQFRNDETNNITSNNATVYQDTLSAKTITNNEPSKNIVQQNIQDSNADNNNITHNNSLSITQNISDASHKPEAKKSSLANNGIPKWQWGITALYGRSSLVENIIDFDKSFTPAALNNGGGGNITYNNKIYTSSESYNIGSIVERKIFKNGSINVGLNYIHLSVKSTTDNQIDSTLYLQYDNGNQLAVPSYYNPGKLLNYKSTFNFIELPVNFQQNIFNKNKIALSYNAGVSLRQLLNSKSLIYDSYSNVYYSNNSLLRQTQFQFLAGLNLSFKTAGNSSVFIGPQFSYSLSGLTKTNNGHFHFMTYGLQTGILLHKK